MAPATPAMANDTTNAVIFVRATFTPSTRSGKLAVAYRRHATAQVRPARCGRTACRARAGERRGWYSSPSSSMKIGPIVSPLAKLSEPNAGTGIDLPAGPPEKYETFVKMYSPR